ncbi:TcmI family type II polyketide cyclase [Streptomyces sp. RKAG290]|uniref:TcmI family type II polyketide cyclase n=1 Tax=Streptomyces sp. RKAG290 TaxID=2888348 RepID=UPI002034298F|nr:TcmI family type II polyketide cyclase [Streptomyces sp. RKAG290]MCM2414291.1 TcmI family type II polyketide cyclase [Streptomyces sp. RKAG290]
MHSTLIVARMNPESRAEVTRLFGEFDATEMPALMGTRRRQLFTYQGLYFHLQDFDHAHGSQAVEEAKTDPRFKQISADLRPFIDPYDPAWQTPSDAMAERFYTWSPQGADSR